MKSIAKGWSASSRSLRQQLENRAQLFLQLIEIRLLLHRRRRLRHLRLQLLLRPRDGEPFRIEQLLDAQDDVDLAPRVEPLSAAALVRRERRELRLPIPQDVRLDIRHAADLADFVELLFGHEANYRQQTACVVAMTRV